MLKLIQVGVNKRINLDNINAVIDHGRRMEIQMIGTTVEIKDDDEWLEKTRVILDQHNEEIKPVETELPFQKEIDPGNHELPAIEIIADGDDLIEEAVDETIILDAIEEGLCVNYITCNRQDIDDRRIRSLSMCVKDVNTYGCYMSSLINDTLCSNFHVCDDQTKGEFECISGCDYDCYRLPTGVVEDLEAMADALDTITTADKHPDLCQIYDICVRPVNVHNEDDCSKSAWQRCYMSPRTCANYRECMLNEKDRTSCINVYNRDCYIDPADPKLKEDDKSITKIV